MFKIKILYIAIITLFLNGCASVQQLSTRNIEQMAGIWMLETAVIQMESVFKSSDGVFISYKAFSKNSDKFKVFYTQLSWDEKYYQKELEKQDAEYTHLVTDLKFMNGEDWKQAITDAQQVAILTEEHWQAFHQMLVQAVTPTEPLAGVIFNAEVEDTLFFYDNENTYQQIDISKKPKNVALVKQYSTVESNQILVDVINQYLLAIDHEEIHICFVKARDSLNQPFLFMDKDKKIIVKAFLKFGRRGRYISNVKRRVNSADHMILGSHGLRMIMRPFSSAYVLFNKTKGTVLDIIPPNPFALLTSKKRVPLYEGPGMDLIAWEKYLDKNNGGKSYAGQMDFLIDGSKFFPRLFDVIQSAEESIRIRTFIFDNDAYGTKLATALKNKSRAKDVKVKVLLDGMGIIMSDNSDSTVAMNGRQTPESIVHYLKKDSNVKVRVRPNAWFKADHTKTTVIDGKICFTGGMNFGREYRYDWHDMMMELSGPVVDAIDDEFNKAWAYSGVMGDYGYFAKKISYQKKRNKAVDGTAQLRLLFTKTNNPQIFKSQLAAIRKSKKYIYIHNAYFSDNLILRELIKARARGVDVRVILPVRGNHSIMNASNVVAANMMFNHGIRVYFYPGMSHVKAAIYDGWMCSGSANFDKLSLRDNVELNVATSDKNIVDTLREQLFETDFKKSMEMREPISSGLKERIAEFLAEQL